MAYSVLDDDDHDGEEKSNSLFLYICALKLFAQTGRLSALLLLRRALRLRDNFNT